MDNKIHKLRATSFYDLLRGKKNPEVLVLVFDSPTVSQAKVPPYLLSWIPTFDSWYNVVFYSPIMVSYLFL